MRSVLGVGLVLESDPMVGRRVRNRVVSTMRDGVVLRRDERYGYEVRWLDWPEPGKHLTTLTFFDELEAL